MHIIIGAPSKKALHCSHCCIVLIVRESPVAVFAQQQQYIIAEVYSSNGCTIESLETAHAFPYTNSSCTRGETGNFEQFECTGSNFVIRNCGNDATCRACQVETRDGRCVSQGREGIKQFCGPMPTIRNALCQKIVRNQAACPGLGQLTFHPLNKCFGIRDFFKRVYNQATRQVDVMNCGTDSTCANCRQEEVVALGCVREGNDWVMNEVTPAF